MTIRNRLYLGFGVQLLLILAFAFFMMHTLKELNEDTVKIVNGRYEEVRLLSKFRYEMNNMTNELRGLSLNATDQQRNVSLKLLESYRHNADVVLNILNTLTDNDESRQGVSEIRIAFLKYQNINDFIIAAMKDGDQQLLESLLYDGVQQQGYITQILDILQNNVEIDIQTELQRAVKLYNRAVYMVYTCVGMVLVLGAGITFYVVRGINRNLRNILTVISASAAGTDYYFSQVEVHSRDELGEIGIAYNRLAYVLNDYIEKEHEQNWLNTQIVDLLTATQRAEDITVLSRYFIETITPAVGANYGLIYLLEELNGSRYLKKHAAYAAKIGQDVSTGFFWGEGLVGQCAAANTQIVLDDIPADYIKIGSGFGEILPNTIILQPIAFENEVLGVIELALLGTLKPIQQDLLKDSAANLGITLTNIYNHMKVEKLLLDSQTLSEELQTQSEELQTQQEELHAQQQELLAINEQLAAQYSESECKSHELENAKADLEEQANQLMVTSKYKSEFLANMSHELRTPLNSLLILAQILVENRTGNLTEKQIEYANTIYSSGTDLLHLINDMLDLAKIEAGRMAVNYSVVGLAELEQAIVWQFAPLARRKGIEFTTKILPGVPEAIWTDEQRVQQILKNLLANAFKFTEKGSVQLEFRTADPEIFDEYPTTGNIIQTALAIAVIDTGIGISDDKLDIIFKAFCQADGTTSRRYGGTGLGLTISRDIAQLLGGFIQVESSVGHGSTFILYLPAYQAVSIEEAVLADEMSVLRNTSHDEDDPLLSDKKILVVDDDMRNVFALTTVLENQRMQVEFADTGKNALEVLERAADIDLVLMDIMMPEMDGYETIRAIRRHPVYKDIPVIALTAKAMKNDREECLKAGASDYISKPVNAEQLLSVMRVWLSGK